MSKLKAVILAAGAGTRMVSEIPKVLHKVLDRSMLVYVIEAAKEAGAEEVCVVVGHKAETVINETPCEVEFVEQKEQLGTGHAVMQADKFIGDEGNVLILFGDTPLITGNTLKGMVDYHNTNGNSVTVLSTLVSNPEGYGRIIRDNNNTFIKSIEHKDATLEELKVNEINSGMYCFDAAVLKEALKTITPHNAQGEYYLPDAVLYVIEKKLKADALIIDSYEEIIGVNSRVQLAEVSKIMQKRINEQHMLSGVTMINPEQAYIGKDVVIGMDTVIYPNSFLEGKTSIGVNCTIGPNAKLISSVVNDYSTIDQSTVIKSSIGEHTNVGPYAYVRPDCTIGDHVKIGDFVEIKNAMIGNNTKVSHLTYIGDADVGEYVNFGCGTVVVNYDGVHKHRTSIKDYAFIGCNTNLISPVNVEEKAYTAAGSTITKDVPAYSLGIARAQQVNIEDWVKRKRNKPF
ncbi:MAG: bifunctional UDP-N-acetylglucosamine diphosphorylase/glucosamine-1-phosphate N-acetyltransferase GlmU [Firmicutes bacterium HGW-Firmicutes-1]|jgi:bifunctional UDP-N-acetylglucosamine pyrophosphorylase/glucosamine-1-phosphate N-acetyltransferase|nr:MAG: bifunctional UDP-N-acetylglucosamine diphosphorylase/glucosamine-1-phosphate N-acetyltransferase GlmU [Firmicutes bacterium HGW-Firmicutes-1]